MKPLKMSIAASPVKEWFSYYTHTRACVTEIHECIHEILYYIRVVSIR